MDYKPLEGLRVVELGTYVAVPSAARIMADWGAEVIKIEPPSGDPWRYVGRVMGIPANDEENAFWLLNNSSKRGISLNLKTESGQKALDKLISNADIFISNTRLQSLDKMGFGYEELSKKYPELIYAHFTGFGEVGPDANRPGFDIASFWARSGALGDWSAVGSYPFKPSAAFGDNTTSSIFLAGILAAVVGREKTGKGQKVSTSLYGTATWYANHKVVSDQEAYNAIDINDEMKPLTPMNYIYTCKDGKRIMLALPGHDQFIPMMCRLAGLEHLIGDERYATIKRAQENMPELITIFREAFMKKDRAEWSEIFAKNDVVHENIAETKDIAKDQQAWANDFLTEYEFESGNKVIMPRTPIKFGKSTPGHEEAPKLGEHTKEILEEIGYSENDIDSLVENKDVVARK